MGVAYYWGGGVDQDYKAAHKWFALAAEQEFAFAQYMLGHIFQNGDGVIQDYKAAITWYRMAAEGGNASAQSRIAFMHARGLGIVQDYTRAHMWWNIAASQGDEIAVKNRGKIEKKMTPSQIEKAQDLARECVAKVYKDC